MKKLQLILLTFFALAHFCISAQYPGAAGTVGSTAIFKDSTIFKSWATGCTLQRGLQDISDTSLGYATVGDYTDALGKAGTNGVVSLGDAGEAILTFSSPIINGSGADFAVFENSFSDFFLELAFVEVSSDGQRFVRFPAYSDTQIDSQIWLNYGCDPTKIHNLAGKYRALYGTPFDLEDLKDSVGINLQAITHIKLVDIVGDISPKYARYDQNNRPINDPFPTPYPSSGFDLDALGVIHQLPNGLEEKEIDFAIYPNPFSAYIQVKADLAISLITIQDVQGKQLIQETKSIINTAFLTSGVYFIKVQFTDGSFKTIKVIKW